MTSLSLWFCFVVSFPALPSSPSHSASPRFCVLFSFNGCPRPLGDHIPYSLLWPSLSFLYSFALRPLSLSRSLLFSLCFFFFFFFLVCPPDFFILSPLLHPRAHHPCPCSCLPTTHPLPISKRRSTSSLQSLPLVSLARSLARLVCLDPRQQQLFLAERTYPWSGWWLQNCHPPERNKSSTAAKEICVLLPSVLPDGTFLCRPFISLLSLLCLYE